MSTTQRQVSLCQLHKDKCPMSTTQTQVCTHVNYTKTSDPCLCVHKGQVSHVNYTKDTCPMSSTQRHLCLCIVKGTLVFVQTCVPLVFVHKGQVSHVKYTKDTCPMSVDIHLSLCRQVPHLSSVHKDTCVPLSSTQRQVPHVNYTKTSVPCQLTWDT